MKQDNFERPSVVRLFLDNILKPESVDSFLTRPEFMGTGQRPEPDLEEHRDEIKRITSSNYD